MITQAYYHAMNKRVDNKVGSVAINKLPRLCVQRVVKYLNE